MKKIAVMVEDNYQVLEILCRYLHLKEKEIAAVFVITRGKEFKSNDQTETAIQKIKPEDFNGVVIYEGSAPPTHLIKELQNE